MERKTDLVPALVECSGKTRNHKNPYVWCSITDKIILTSPWYSHAPKDLD